MNQYFKILLLFFTFNTTFIFSQNDNPPTDSKKENESINVFDTDNSSNKKAKKSTKNYQEMNMIKLDLLQIAAANIIFSYERVLNNRLGIELGLGASYPAKALGVLSFWESDDFSSDDDGNPKFGPYASFQLKYYTDAYDSPEGWFVGLGARYSSFGHDPPEDASLGSSSKSESRIDLLRVTFGKTVIWDRFVNEWYVGGGIKQTSSTRYEYTTGTYTTSEATKKSGLFLTFGYKLGIYF